MIALKNGYILEGGALKRADILIDGGIIAKIAPYIEVSPSDEVFDCFGHWITAGAVDVHAHLREPGYTHKETILSGTASAAKGGITSLMSMPNLNPCPDSPENLAVQQKIIDKDALVKVYPFAALTLGEKGERLADIKALASLVKGFSDDGRCVNNLKLLEEGMRLVKKEGGIIASHPEAEGYPADEAEWVAVEREAELAIKTGCRYHFCHLSLKKSFDILRQAKKAGGDITCEVMPHHLFLDGRDVKGNPDAKMSPPLRSPRDREATLTALLDGTADMIATDHAPHSPEEKALPFDQSPNGIIGFETLMPLVFTGLVKTGLAAYEDMQKWVTINPATRFGIPYGQVKEGGLADLAVLDISNPHVYEAVEVVSRSKNSPFFGSKLYGFNSLTVAVGKVIYDRTGGHDERKDAGAGKRQSFPRPGAGKRR